MKKKLAKCISGLVLLLGIGSYLALSNSQISAKENTKQSSEVMKENLPEHTKAGSPSTFATNPNSILNSKNYKAMNPSDTLPEEYTFIAKPNVNTRYFVVNQKTREKISEYKISSTTKSIPIKGSQTAAYFSDVGKYAGKTVDMMISIGYGFTTSVGIENSSGISSTSFGSLYRLFDGSSYRGNIVYSYYDNATGEPLVVKGVFSMFLDSYNYYSFDWNYGQADQSYVSYNSKLNYDYTNKSTTTDNITGSGSTSIPIMNQPEYFVTSVYTKSSFSIGTRSNASYSMGTYYITTPVARMKIPGPEITGSVEEDGSKNKTDFSINMIQNVPMRMFNFSKYKTLDYTLPTHDLYNITSFKVLNYKTGADVSSNFTLVDNKLSAASSFLNSDGFYGENYEIILNYDLDTTKDYFSLYKDGCLEIPYDSITQSSDLDGVQTSNTTTARIKWNYLLGIEAKDVEYSQGEVKRLNKDTKSFKEKVLKDSEAKGTNLNLNTDVPVTITDFVVGSKAGIYPITLSTQDGDSTFTKKINVNVKAIPPVVTIPEAGTRVVSSKGMPYSFNGTVSDEDSEDMSLFVTVDDGAPTTIWEKQENTELNQPIDFTYEIPGAQLLVLGDHTVKVYAKDSEGNQSEVVQFTLDVRGYLAFKDMPPETLDFDATKIGSKGSYSKLNKSVDFSVEDYRGSNTSWKLVGSLTSELQDSATKTTIKDGIIYRDEDGNETPFTTDATVKLSTGKATASNVLFPIKWGTDDKGIFIKTPPDVKKGTYTGGIEMSLVDAP
ncbi:hypothetical protein A5881_002398 [Enterococcus termitis]|nr:hypothetical protein A5881_001282 [Enterococcus termitis]